MQTGNKFGLDVNVNVDDFRRCLPARISPYLTDKDIAGILSNIADWLADYDNWDGDPEHLVWLLKSPLEEVHE